MAVWRIRESICVIISAAEGEPGPAEEGCRQLVAVLQEGVWGVHALTSFRSHCLISCKCLRGIKPTGSQRTREPVGALVTGYSSRAGSKVERVEGGSGGVHGKHPTQASSGL